MSILIRGMEMPRSRGEYELRLYVDSDGSATVEGAYRDFEGEPFEAVTVPPHGRLIDADAAIYDIRCEILEHQMNGLNGTPCYLDDLRTMWQRLEDEDIIPTIIETEDEDGGL